MEWRTLHLVFILWFCFLCETSRVTICCRDKERQALLSFKQSLDDTLQILCDWKGGDCCRWAGVVCSNRTGHVIKLRIGSLISNGEFDYECPFSSSHLDHSLSALKHLQYLDLSYTYFNYTSIPQYIGSFTSLRNLNLSLCHFAGAIPHHLGNLTNLQYLDLGNNGNLRADNLQWLSQISYLQYLDMSWVNLTDVIVKQPIPAASVPLNLSSIPTIHDWFLNLSHSLVHLNLAGCNIHGPIPHAMGNLSSLKFLSLSNNILTGFVPESLSQLSGLEILDLSLNSLNGSVPESLGQLSGLKTLDLSYNSLNGSFPESLSQLSGLKTLDLSSNFLNGSVPESLGQLSGLKTLDLSYNSLNGSVPENLGQLSGLEILDLSRNFLKGFIPGILGNLCNLQTLDLSYNEIVGDLSGMVVGQQRCRRYSLETLDLSSNQLSGSLPDWIGQMRNLKSLFLNNNILNGSVAESLGQLSELETLDLKGNPLQGVVSDAHFANMTKLEELSLCPSSLSFNMSSTWVPPFQLQVIDLASCRLGPQFPSWLRTQRELSFIDISNAGISNIVPDWFWKVSSGVIYLNISHNQLSGEVPSSLNFHSAITIDLSSNQLQGHLPYLNSSVSYLVLSDNLFSGDLQPIFNETWRDLTVVILSRNLLTGKIPSAICKLESIQILDLSYNNLSGKIPKCRADAYLWTVINLASNDLWGSIPRWMGSLQSLQLLRLSNNNFHGEIPFLRNCTDMIILDLGENKLTGNIPTWFGESLSSLRFLSLRSNMLNGTIPQTLSYLTSLQVLDLAHNYLSGTIPCSFKNFTAMVKLNKTVEDIFENVTSYSKLIGLDTYEKNFDVVTKGRDLEYTNTLSLVMLLDLSCNNLSGRVPIELMNLVGLQSLNLSENQLRGKIPDKIGDMVRLETLDLSRNQLSGAIPWSITSLTALSHLDLSYNNLSGRIPSGNQLQTLTDPSIYEGNRNLCGFPLPKACPGDESSEVPIPVDGEDYDNGSDMFGLYLSMGLGFVVGLWGVCGVFLFKNSWMIAYFQFVDDMANKIYVAKESLKRMMVCAIVE